MRSPFSRAIVKVIGAPLLANLFLIGCSTYSTKQCREMDWQQQGSNTAMKGRTQASGEAYFEYECSGVPMNKEAFTTGYKQALTQFCTPENIRVFSERGGIYQGTCPEAASDPNFNQSLQTGRGRYLEKRVVQLEKEVDYYQSELSDAKNKIDDLQSKQCQ